MSSRIMGIVMIIAGLVLIIFGIFTLTKNNEPDMSSDANYDHNDDSQSIIADQNLKSDESNEPFSETEIQPEEEEPTSKTTENTSKSKGDAFEDFVVNLLADWRLKLLDRTQDKVSTAGVIAESCKNPDLHVQQKRGDKNIDYYLECKYRSRWTSDGKVTFDDWQINRYRKFQHDNHRKVILALGVGGSPSDPATFMLVPLDSIKDNTIKKVNTEFCVKPASADLVEYMNDYFNKVFNKARQKSGKS